MKPQKKAPSVPKRYPAAVLRREMREIRALTATLPRDMSFLAELEETPVQECRLAGHLLPTADKRLLQKRAFLVRALRLGVNARKWKEERC